MTHKIILSILLIFPYLSIAGMVGEDFEIKPDIENTRSGLGQSVLRLGGISTYTSCIFIAKDFIREGVNRITTQEDVGYKYVSCTFRAPEGKTIELHYNQSNHLLVEGVQSPYTIDITGTVTKQFEINIELTDSKLNPDNPLSYDMPKRNCVGSLKFFHYSNEPDDIVTARCDITGSVED